ncbi:ribbon-helix-helix protein, CopG family [Actinoallomurus soli]|uniref:ribbon-helix-helix protein, CopG family n=1 Tax=Actinoallomurus soli TaxID=2952535 RepID=UPI00209280BA|nr:ribbon-helix-helix protein, CopG family [Actinoallomurus soli]MCO5970581.1 ribbon-helix-helix domain-containing protein [Actinoallomurus soli]
MGTVTVRVSADTRDRIAALARESGRPMSAVIDEAMRDYEHKRFFGDLNRQIAATRADPEAWADHQAEAAVFDKAAGDGLSDLDDTDYSAW